VELFFVWRDKAVEVGHGKRARMWMRLALASLLIRLLVEMVSQKVLQSWLHSK